MTAAPRAQGTGENLGIERLVANTIANPHLRFVVVGGPEAGGQPRSAARSPAGRLTWSCTPTRDGGCW